MITTLTINLAITFVINLLFVIFPRLILLVNLRNSVNKRPENICASLLFVDSCDLAGERDQFPNPASICTILKESARTVHPHLPIPTNHSICANFHHSVWNSTTNDESSLLIVRLRCRNLI